MVEDCRGLRYIAVLISNAAAGRGPVHARELVALATGQATAPIELAPKDYVLDDAGRRRMMERLEDLVADRDRACALGNFESAAGLDEEYERIAAELSHGGRSRKGRAGRGAFNDQDEEACDRD
jgi:hypothetical protein